MTYYDVPDVPGVPPLLRAPGPAPAQPILLSADAPQAYAAPQIKWGIYDSNLAPVIVGETVSVFEFRKEYRVIDYPVEQGSFSSYNKVQLPFEARLTFMQGGTDGDRQAFLAEVQATCDAVASASDPLSLALFTVLTPEVVYPNVTITHYDFSRRAKNGVTLLAVDVWVRQVRPVSGPQFANTKSASGASQQDDGTVQPVGDVSLGTPTWQ